MIISDGMRPARRNHGGSGHKPAHIPLPGVQRVAGLVTSALRALPPRALAVDAIDGHLEREDDARVPP